MFITNVILIHNNVIIHYYIIYYIILSYVKLITYYIIYIILIIILRYYYMIKWVLYYTTLFAPSSITALIIPIMVTLCHNLVRLPPISLLQRGKKNRSKVPSRESDHAQPCPTLWFFKSKADGPVWKEERVTGSWRLDSKGVHILQNKNKKKNNNSDFCSR